MFHFCFDPLQVLQLVNSAGERLLQNALRPSHGRTAAEIGLQTCLAAPTKPVRCLKQFADALAGAPQFVSAEWNSPTLCWFLSDIKPRFAGETERLAAPGARPRT